MSKKKFDPYKELTDRIVKRLEEGEVPWISAFNNVNVGYPRNFITDKVYKGANFFMTLFEERETPYWLTYKQAKDLGVDMGSQTKKLGERIKSIAKEARSFK